MRFKIGTLLLKGVNWYWRYISPHEFLYSLRKMRKEKDIVYFDEVFARKKI